MKQQTTQASSQNSLNITTNNFIYIYYQQIKDGTVHVSKWVEMAYERIVDGIQKGKWHYDAKKANKAVTFIESFCHHHKGDLRGQPLKLEIWQKAFIQTVFGIVNSEGKRQFQEALLVVGRKNGKTLICSSVAEFMAFADGVQGGEIYFIAPKLQQANLCYDGLFQMILKEPSLSELTKKRRTDMYIPAFNTTIQPLAFSEKKSDGLSPSLVILDEVSSWPPESGNKQYEVIKSAIGSRTMNKSQPLILNISTAGYTNGGPYDELIKRGTQWLMGNSKEERFFPLIYQIDDETRWNDISELERSNPNLGVSVPVDFYINEIASAEMSYSKKAEFLTKYCNIKQTSSMAWLSASTINKAFQQTYDLSDFRHSYAVAGLDLSSTIDLTSVSVVIERDGILHTFTHLWLPTGKLEEATKRDSLPYEQYIAQGWLTLSGDQMVDYHDVINYFSTLITKYQIIPIIVGYDRWSASYIVEELKQQGLIMDSVQQYFNLSPVIDEMEGLLLDGKINISDDNQLVKQHMANAALEYAKSNGRKRVVKILDQSNIHIDSVASLIDALTVRQKYAKQYGEILKNKNQGGK